MSAPVHDLSDLFSFAPPRHDPSLSIDHPPLPSPTATDPMDWSARFDALIVIRERELALARRLPIDMQERVPTASGVYAIYYRDRLVYIGSADKMRGRLREHRASVRSAGRIDRGEVAYIFILCSRHASLAIESRLIAHYAPPWNSTGFGSKVNGNGRRHQRPSKWDVTFGRPVRR